MAAKLQKKARFGGKIARFASKMQKRRFKKPIPFLDSFLGAFFVVFFLTAFLFFRKHFNLGFRKLAVRAKLNRRIKEKPAHFYSF